MAEFLTTITDHVRSETTRRQRQVPAAALRDRPLFTMPTRGFARGLRDERRHVIAEVKRASPSKGLIREDFDPVAIARDYVAHGASAISVLTEERFFQGSLNYLEEIKTAVPVPLLRKDFILDPYQLIEARSYGADAILLIAALLEPMLLSELRHQANALALDALVEVHNEQELRYALDAGAQLIGINNRDLRSFEVNLAISESLAPLVPPGILSICESGIESTEQIQRFEKLGIHVFLIGEYLMRAAYPGKMLSELLSSEQSAKL
jgi:indole-3-glycerol phosphate synthase